jgi:hypothetical protein
MTTRIPDTWTSTDHVRETRDKVAREAQDLLARAETRAEMSGDGLSGEERLELDELLSVTERLTETLQRRERDDRPVSVTPSGVRVPRDGRAVAGDGRPHAMALATRSLGQRITDHAAYPAWRTASGSVGFDLSIERRAISGSVCGGLIVPPPPVLAVGAPPRLVAMPARVSDLLTHSLEGSTACSYPEFGARTGSSGVVPPATAKPDVGVSITFKAAVFAKIAGWTVIADELLEDAEGVAQAIDAELVLDLLDTLDNEILNATGTPPRFLGLIPASAAPDHAAGSETPVQAILTTAANVHAASGLPADGVVCSYATAIACASVTASTSGVFMTGAPALGATPVWTGGLALAIGPVPDGQALVGSFMRGAALTSKRAVRIERSSSGDLFVSNQTLIRIEQRTALTIFRPLAFALCTGLPGGTP